MLRKNCHFLLSAMIVPLCIISCNKVRNINTEERSKRLKWVEKPQDNSYQLTVTQFRGLNYWKVELYFWNSNGNIHQFNLINKDLSPNFIAVSNDGEETTAKVGEVQCKDPECRVKEAQLDLDFLRSRLTKSNFTNNSDKVLTSLGQRLAPWRLQSVVDEDTSIPAQNYYTITSKKEKTLNVYSRQEREDFELEIWDSQNKLKVSKSKIKAVLFSYDEQGEEILSYIQLGEDQQGRVVLSFERSDFMVPAIHTENLSFHLKAITISGIQAEDLPFLSSSSIRVNPCIAVQDSPGNRAVLASVARVQENPGPGILEWCGSFVTFDLPSQTNQEFKIKFSRKKSE